MVREREQIDIQQDMYCHLLAENDGVTVIGVKAFRRKCCNVVLGFFFGFFLFLRVWNHSIIFIIFVLIKGRKQIPYDHQAFNVHFSQESNPRPLARKKSSLATWSPRVDMQTHTCTHIHT